MSSSTAVALYNDADDAKKLQVLKKAVIALTKQKQELESTNEALSTKLAELGGALSEAHETENQLRNELHTTQDKLQKAQLQLQQANTGLKGATATVTNGVATLKGLFATTNHGAGGGHGASNPPTSPSLAATQDAASQLLQENEALHVQMFELRSQHTTATKAAAEESKKLQQRITDLEKENRKASDHMAEQERDMQSTSMELDSLRSAMTFVQTFLALSDGSTVQPVEAPTVGFAASVSKAEVSPSLTHGASRLTGILMEAVEGIQSAVGGLVTATKDVWEERTASKASQEVRQLRLLLAVLAASKGLSIGAPLKALNELCLREVCDHSHFAHTQLSVLQPVEAWLYVISPYLRTLVEGSLPVAVRNAKYRLPASMVSDRPELLLDAEKRGNEVVVPRDVVVDVLFTSIRRHLVEQHGTLQVLQALIARRLRSGGLPSGVPSSPILFYDIMCVAAQKRGPAAGSSLSDCLGAWSDLVIEPRVKRCIDAIRKEVTSLTNNFAPRQGGGRGAIGVLQSGSTVEPLRAEHSPAVTTGASSSPSMQQMVLQADRACAMYFTQAQHALSELLLRNSQLEQAKAAQARLQAQLRQRDEEHGAMREAYEQHIQVLSDSLTRADAVSP